MNNFNPVSSVPQTILDALTLSDGCNCGCSGGCGLGAGSVGGVGIVKDNCPSAN